MTRCMRGFIAALMLLAIAMSSFTATAATMGVMPVGEITIVDDGAGRQTDPHIRGTLVAYTSQQDGGTEIRYHDLSTSDGDPIPGGGDDRLADVSGSTVVFTRTHFDRIAIHAFDAPDGSTTELDPLIGSIRSNPSIGGSTVVWEDRGPVDAEFPSQEIVVYDLGSEISTRLTDDSSVDAWPAVSADGSVIVWEKCVTTSSSGCDIWQATWSGIAWTTTQVTGGEGESNQPDTNGDVVVYQATRAGETDIFWKPVGGGAEQQLALPGAQIRPSISGDLIAFESGADILVYDLGSDTLYPITDTPDITEQLPDIFVGDGVARIVYTSEDAAGERDIHAFSFNLPSEDMTPPTLTLPDDITVDATSPEGAVVSYDVTARDETDGNPTVDCQPPSGSIFPVGMTTVNCTATDDANNQAEGSFTVMVQDAHQQLEDIDDLVQSFDLQSGTESSLDAKLNAAVKALARDQSQTACNVLDAFINSVEAQAGNKLTHDQAHELIEAALRVQVVADCVD